MELFNHSNNASLKARAGEQELGSKNRSRNWGKAHQLENHLSRHNDMLLGTHKHMPHYWSYSDYCVKRMICNQNRKHTTRATARQHPATYVGLPCCKSCFARCRLNALQWSHKARHKCTSCCRRRHILQLFVALLHIHQVVRSVERLLRTGHKRHYKCKSC